MKQKTRYILLGVILTLVCIYIGTLVKIEILTHNHKDELVDVCKENTMVGDDFDFFKVLEYSECGFARVYFISVGMYTTTGNVFTLGYEDGEWYEVSWDTRWSTSGNADKTVYPYFWHWVHFMFEW